MTGTNKATVKEQLQAAAKSLEYATFEIRCAHERVTSMTATYLIIVYKDGERWIIDEDSEHILEGEDCPVLELQVSTIRALVDKVELPKLPKPE